MTILLTVILFCVFCVFLTWALTRHSKSKRDGNVYFYLDEKGNGHIKWFPKGASVDGVILSKEDLNTLKEKGSLDISNRKHFKTKE
jgi:hypothetical protein